MAERTFRDEDTGILYRTDSPYSGAEGDYYYEPVGKEGDGEFDWGKYGKNAMNTNQAYLNAEMSMNAARVAAQLAINAAQLAEARYEFDTAFFNLSAFQKEQFSWMRESFYAELDEKKRQFDRGQYGELATTLLNAAVALHGQPQDWVKYATFTSGGKDIFKTLFGDQPAPEYGMPSGYSAPMSVVDILKALGVTKIPGVGAATGTATKAASTSAAATPATTSATTLPVPPGAETPTIPDTRTSLPGQVPAGGIPPSVESTSATSGDKFSSVYRDILTAIGGKQAANNQSFWPGKSNVFQTKYGDKTVDQMRRELSLLG